MIPPQPIKCVTKNIQFQHTCISIGLYTIDIDLESSVQTLKPGDTTEADALLLENRGVDRGPIQHRDRVTRIITSGEVEDYEYL